MGVGSAPSPADDLAALPVAAGSSNLEPKIPWWFPDLYWRSGEHGANTSFPKNLQGRFPIFPDESLPWQGKFAKIGQNLKILARSFLRSLYCSLFFAQACDSHSHPAI